MKNILIVALLGASVVLGAVLYNQNRKAAQIQSSAADLQQQLSQAQSDLATKQKQSERLKTQLDTSRETAAELASKQALAQHAKDAAERALAAQKAKLAPSSNQPGQTQDKTNSFASLMSDMFKSSGTRDMLKAQQKPILGATIDKNYGKLISNLKLTDEQSAKLKDMLLDRQLDTASIAMAMLSGETNSTNGDSIAKQTQDSIEASNAKLKDFLGTNNYATFEEYEKTLTERSTMSSFKFELGAGSAMTDSQEESLVAAMAQERQNFKFTTDLNGGSGAKALDMFAGMTDEKIDQYTAELEQLNQNYIAQAQTILTPAQLTAYEKFLKNQQALTKTSLQLASKMFGK